MTASRKSKEQLTLAPLLKDPKVWKEENRQKSYPLFEKLGEEFEIKRLTDFQFRINGRIDIYPTRGRFHDIRTNQRGSVGKDLVAFVKKFFAELPPVPIDKPVEKPHEIRIGQPLWKPFWADMRNKKEA